MFLNVKSAVCLFAGSCLAVEVMMSAVRGQSPPRTEEAIRRVLAQPVKLQFQNQPMARVVAELRQFTGVAIRIGQAAGLRKVTLGDASQPAGAAA